MPLTTAPSLVIMSLGSPEVNALMNMMNMRMVLIDDNDDVWLIFWGGRGGYIHVELQHCRRHWSRIQTWCCFHITNSAMIIDLYPKKAKHLCEGFARVVSLLVHRLAPNHFHLLDQNWLSLNSNAKNYIYSMWEDWLSVSEGRSVVWPKAPNFMRA